MSHARGDFSIQCGNNQSSSLFTCIVSGYRNEIAFFRLIMKRSIVADASQSAFICDSESFDLHQSNIFCHPTTTALTQSHFQGEPQK